MIDSSEPSLNGGIHLSLLLCKVLFVRFESGLPGRPLEQTLSLLDLLGDVSICTCVFLDSLSFFGADFKISVHCNVRCLGWLFLKVVRVFVYIMT